MNDQDLLARITADPAVMVGKPVIRGTRLTVDFILNLLAHGAHPNEILGEYPGLAAEDIQACLLFAARSLESTDFHPLQPQAERLANTFVVATENSVRFGHPPT